MTTRNIYDLAQEWNNGATDFTAIKMNVTDTASASTSKLLDLQVGGSSRFSVTKSGRLDLAANGTINTVSGFGQLQIAAANRVVWTSAGLLINGYLNIGSTGVPDVQLNRDAANTLALRNGVNAQSFNIYNTHTDASNYERGCIKWSSNVLTIGTEAAGTGAVRNVRVNSSDRFSVFDSAGTSELRLDANISGAGLKFEAWNGANRRGQLSFRSDQPRLIWATSVPITIGYAALDSVSTGFSIQNSGIIKIIGTLPTTDPAVAGQVWNDSGTLKISAG